MTAFEYVTAVLLLILGLGVTRLLGAMVEAVRVRERIQLHWIPLVWAVIIFLWQIQFLWAAFELNRLVDTWTAGKFIFMVGLALLLFVSGALVLPRDPASELTNGLETFRQDGRWALVFLSIYFGAAFFANYILFGLTLLHPLNIFVLSLGLILIVGFFTKRRKALIAVTVLFGTLSIVGLVLLSPPAYQTP